MDMFKNIDWQKGLLEGALAVGFFLIVYLMITIMVFTSGRPIDPNLQYILTILTTTIMYFNMMDKRDMDKRLDEIVETLETIEDTTEATWDIQRMDDEDFTIDELREMIEDLQIEIDVKSESKARDLK